MNGDEYRHLDSKIDGLADDLAELQASLARINTRLDTIWRVFGVLGAIGTAVAGWFGLH